MKRSSTNTNTVFLVLLFSLVTSEPLFCQKLLNLSGKITDAFTGKQIPFSVVEIRETHARAFANSTGDFRLNTLVYSDSVSLLFRAHGYQARDVRIAGFGLKHIDMSLMPESSLLQEVIVNASAQNQNSIESSNNPAMTLTQKEIKGVPALLGEVDLLKVLQLKPGMVPGAEGSAGFSVRGGATDQNLMLLDHAVVYNAAHLFGFMSNFNSDIIQDVKAWKGGFPAQFGGRLSSVISIQTRDGNDAKTNVSGGIGLISSRLTIEGPLKKEKISWLVSARRTYVDLITQYFNDRKSKQERIFKPIPSYDFYDLNAKMVWQVSQKDNLSFTGFFSHDNFRYKNIDFDFIFKWQNSAGALRWRHFFKPESVMNTTLSTSAYNFYVRDFAPGFSIRMKSGIRDLSLKSDIMFNANKRHLFRTGASASIYRFTVNQFNAGSDNGAVSLGAGESKLGREIAAYCSDEWAVANRFKVNAGMRLSAFSDGQTPTGGIEPRLSTHFSPGKRLTFAVSYARMFQYLHQLSSSGFSFPADVWYPSTRIVRPEISDQVGIGASFRPDPNYSVNWEVYYKRLYNQIELKDGGQLFGATSLENEITFGTGRAFAATELEIEKKKGLLTGWIGYTFAKVQKGGFPDINGGQYFSPRHDIRHNFSMVASYKLGKRLNISSTVVYRSGPFAWLPTGRFTLQNVNGGTSPAIIPVFEERNTFRFPHYFRLDLGLIWRWSSRRAEHDLTLSVYNLTNRRNPYFYYLNAEYQTVTSNGQTWKVPKRIKISPVYLFPILPSLTWNFNF